MPEPRLEHRAEDPAETMPIRRDVEVELDVDEVWELLVDDDERADWFGGPTTLEPVPGSPATFTDPDGTRRTGTVDDVVPGRRLSWTWWPEDDDDNRPSRVDIDLEPQPGGTRISVTEFPLAPVARASASDARSAVPLLELESMILGRAICHAGVEMSRA